MNGLLIINKPKGYTSHDVVNVLRKKLNTKKVGHTGTLDPNATGVLPILVGAATKISKYLIEHEKTYIATIVLGKKTDTGDIEGKIIEEDSNLMDVDENELEKVIKSFLGKQTQIPPMYSAIKVDGKKLYEYAREGKSVEVKPREIEILDINLIGYENNEIEFSVRCSKGTYIRTLCEDIAKKLGTIGYMKELQRTSVKEFNIEDSISLEELENINVLEKIISIEEIFKDKPIIDLNNRKLELFLNGVQLTHDLEDELYRIYNNNNFIGLGIVKNKLLKRDIVI
ncbi:MAG: tRNA pseudouridine(55) synthase TruB [Clostridia bacterium]|nr:tRNA pseudouridine(55) synthase TruB [Clostridia bacterium]